MSEREFDVIVIGRRRRPVRCARPARRARAVGRDRRGQARRRRVLVLRLHAVEGAAAADRADERGAARAGRHRRRRSIPPPCSTRRDEVIHDLDDSGQLPWLEQRGVSSSAVAAGSTASAACSVGDEALVARAGGRGRDRARRRSCRRSPACRARAVDEHRGDDGEERARPARRCSAAASSASRWRRPGRRSARR